MWGPILRSTVLRAAATIPPGNWLEMRTPGLCLPYTDQSISTPCPLNSDKYNNGKYEKRSQDLKEPGRKATGIRQ